MKETGFSRLSDDVVFNILFKLEDDPRNWARLACVSTKFSSLIRTVCWKSKCIKTVPSLVADLLSGNTSSSPPGGWASLNKLAVCCPGLHHAGVLLDNSDFGLERELGPDQDYVRSSSSQLTHNPPSIQFDLNPSAADCSWSLYDDLYYDTIYDGSEMQIQEGPQIGEGTEKRGVSICEETECSVSKKKRKNTSSRRSIRSHVASGIWNLSREQGTKLLHSRFRGDCLYICDWPGCVHIEERRTYMVFRGFFRNFKESHAWRTIKDGNRSKIDISCAFCSCSETWDLHSAFCLRRVFGYHEDGELVVRAYVCENGHVSGAWTDQPLYS